MATRMVFSCGDSTADIKTGTPTCEVSGTTITFDTAQTGNIGVGDQITYNTSDICFIVGKTSTTVWTVRSATGATPTAATAGTTVNEIKHAFASCNGAFSNFHNASHLNNTNLTAIDIQVDIACYRDTANDTVAVTQFTTAITTDATRYVRVYTPYDTTNECNNIQRHDGKWNTGAYLQTSASGNNWLVNQIGHFRVEGLQIQNTVSSINVHLLRPCKNGTGQVWVEGVLLSMASHGGTPTGWKGLSLNVGSQTCLVSNCAVWDTGTPLTGSQGIAVTAGVTARISHCTVSGIETGFSRTAGTVHAKNCLADCGTAGFSGTFDASSTDNASAQADAPGSNPRNSQTFTFVDATTGDLHLDDTDTGAHGFGADLSADTYPVTVDMDRETRASPFDIGADYNSTAVGGALLRPTIAISQAVPRAAYW